MQRDEIAALTGLRFVAAFCILVPHTIGWTVPFNDSRLFITVASTFGLFGMPLFFVLSGFVIHYNYGSMFATMSMTRAGFAFLSARVARIYPLFIFFFGMGAIIDSTVGWLTYDPDSFWRFLIHFLTMTQSWVFRIGVGGRNLQDNAFGLSWSISTEFFFYLNYLWIGPAILRIRRVPTAVAVLILFTLSAIALVLFANAQWPAILAFAQAHVRGMADSPSAAGIFHQWLFYYSPYFRILEFVLGCLTAHVYLLLVRVTPSPLEKRLGAACTFAAIVMLAAISWSYNGGGPATISGYVQMLSLNFGCAPAIAILLFCVSRYANVIQAALAAAPMRKLGDISYSIYATHTWTVRLFIRGPIDFTALMASEALVRVLYAVIFTLIVSTATYRLIEVPARAIIRKWSAAAMARLFTIKRVSPQMDTDSGAVFDHSSSAALTSEAQPSKSCSPLMGAETTASR
jgi:peptidoglycan/LPS O-acetylase OafA/YrhL